MAADPLKTTPRRSLSCSRDPWRNLRRCST